jgi:hypothetical protein
MPSVFVTTTPSNLTAEYTAAGIVEEKILGIIEYGGGIRSIFNIGISHIYNDANSYMVTVDGATQLTQHKEIATKAAENAAFLSNV